MGFSPVSAFKGYPVYSGAANARKYLLAEDAGAGPCDLQNDALRIAVRTADHKYIWQAAEDGNMERNELYDLKKDPQEKHNLANELGYGTINQELKSIAQQRWRMLKGGC